nr:hypothetical protein [Halomicroarcula nitratireducens]
MTGTEKAPESGRLERVKRDLTDLQTKASETSERAIGDARAKVDVYRQKGRTEA